ncbi:MAG: acetolactate decarboxylase [Syntrophorhabdaceae bacterium]|nr:acetolactate decarboxylase [Syntrophorhabdaceae bacterium]
MADSEEITELEFLLSYDILTQLTRTMERTGCSAADLIEQALRQFLVNKDKGNAVYLSAPINALVEGLYVENTTIAEVKRHGDFGLGTFNYLDGEMLLLDGKVYQIRSDGNVYDVPDDEKSPFACVTFFSPDTFDDIEDTGGSHDLTTLLDNLIPSKNMLYAIRIDGTFSHVRCRAVPRSENYRPLVEATKTSLFLIFTTSGDPLPGSTPPVLWNPSTRRDFTSIFSPGTGAAAVISWRAR